MKPSHYPELHPRAIALILEFVRQHGLASAHYWGYADQGLIMALKDEPGFEFGVSDEYDRWHSGVRFWEGDDTDINVEEYRRPAWLEGVLMYQEGMQNTHCLVYDLPPNAVRDEDRLDLLLGERDITHVALLRPEPMQSPKAADFSWTHLGGFWFGASRQATRAKPTPRSVRIDSIDSNGSNEARANPPRSTTMKPSQIESITKAAQCAQLLVSDIAGAHRLACEGQPALAILLLDLIADAKKLNDRLAQIEAALVRKDPDPASASGA